jgi:hypothetical protein
MLELSNEAPISGSKRPSIGIVDDVIRRHGQEGLDGEHQTLAKHQPLAVVDAWDGRGFMQSSSDAVTVEIS